MLTLIVFISIPLQVGKFVWRVAIKGGNDVTKSAITTIEAAGLENEMQYHLLGLKGLQPLEKISGIFVEHVCCNKLS